MFSARVKALCDSLGGRSAGSRLFHIVGCWSTDGIIFYFNCILACMGLVGASRKSLCSVIIIIFFLCPKVYSTKGLKAKIC